MGGVALELIREQSAEITDPSSDHPLSLTSANTVSQTYDIPQI